MNKDNFRLIKILKNKTNFEIIKKLQGTKTVSELKCHIELPHKKKT